MIVTAGSVPSQPTTSPTPPNWIWIVVVGGLGVAEAYLYYKGSQ